ncbi:MAG: PAS domain-containing protein [Eubacterium sp.]|nr:PAS domain-containing protein [Eubacterium sp.]
MGDKNKDIESMIQSFQPFLNTFNNLIVGGVGLFEVEGEEIYPRYISEGAFALVFGSTRVRKTTAKALRHFVADKDHALLLEAARDAVANGTVLDCTLNYNVLEDQGHYIWVRGTLIEKRENSYLFAALIQDVTQKKNLENELVIQAERYRILEETTNEILFEIDTDRDTMNFSMKEMTGDYIRHRVPHLTRLLKEGEVVHPDYISLVFHHLGLAQKSKTQGSFEYLTQISNRGYEWHKLTYSSVVDTEGKVRRIVGRIKNIHDEVLEKQDTGTRSYQHVYHGVKDKVRMRIQKADLEDSHGLGIISVDDFRNIQKSHGVACCDLIMRNLLEIADLEVGSMGIFDQYEDGKILIYFQNEEEGQIDAVIHSIMEKMKGVNYRVEGLMPGFSAGAAIKHGAVDFSSFMQEAEEALHISKITRGVNYIRV